MSKKKLTLLIIEDSESDAELILRQFKKAGYDTSHERVETAAQMRSALEKQPWDLVIADYHLPEFNAPSALTVLQKSGPDIPFIVVSGVIGEEAAVTLMKAGAHDYIMKDNLARLIPAVNRELSDVQTRREKRETEERLKEEEERFRSIFENSADGILLISVDGTILNANPAACHMLGRSEEEIRQVGHAGVVDLSDPQFAVALEERKLTGKFKSEYFHIRKDGTRFLCEVSSDMFTDKNGQAMSCTIFRDITERKRMAENTERAAEEWRTTFDSIEDMVMLLDLDYRILRVNKALAFFLGLSYDKILGNFCFDLVHWTKQPPEKCPFAKMQKTKRHEEFETYITEKEMWILTSVDPIFDNNGGITGGVYIIKNITARKKTEEALRESEERYRTAIENSNDGVTIVREGTLLFVSRRFLEIFGYERFDDVLKTEEYVTVHPDDRERVRQISQRRMRGEQVPARYEFKGIRKDGTSVDIEASLAPITYLGDAASLLYLRDVTERKRAEDELRNSQKELQTIMDVAPVAVIWADREGNIPYINHKFHELFGYTLEDIPTTADFHRLAYPTADTFEAYADWVLKQKEQLEKGREVLPMEVNLTCKDGSVRQVMVLRAETSDRRIVIYNDITEHNRMEEALRENERKLQAIMDSAPIGISFSDMAGNIEYTNRKFSELFGYTIEDIPNIAEWRRRAYPDPAYRESLAPLVPAMIEAQKQGKTVAPVEVAVTCKDGSTRYVEQTGATAYNRFLALYSDLTERKLMEETIRESENKFRDLVEKSFVGVYLLQDGLFRYVNKRFAEIHGYTIEEMVDKKGALEDTVLPEDLLEVQVDVRKGLKGKDKSFKTEFRIITKQGKIRNVVVYGTRTTYQGKPANIGTLMDITEQKRAGEALRESENKFRDLVEKSNVGVYLIQDGLFRYVNARFADIHGYTIEEMVDKMGTPETVLPEDVPKVDGNIQKRLTGEIESSQYELRIITKQGEIRNVAVYGTRTTYQGKPANIGTLVDITEQKRAEEGLRQKTALLEAQLNSSIEGIMVVDSQGKKVLQNQRTVDLWKIPKHIAENSDDQMQVDHVMRMTKDPKQFVDKVVYLYSHPDETSRDEVELTDGTVFDRYSAPVLGQDGKYYGRIWAFRDITERKRIEDALRESENKFRDLVEKSFVGVYLSQNGLFRYINARFAEIHGYTIEEMVDKMGVVDTVLPEDLPKVDGNIQKRLAGEFVSSRYEFRIVTKQREIRNVVVYGSRTTYRGKPATIGTLMDITEQKRADEMLMDLFKDLEKKNTELENTYSELRESQQKIIQQEKMASIGQLAAGIAHEINNPVAFVMSNLNSMGKYSERLSQFIKIQSEAVERLSKGAGDNAAVLDGLHKKRQALKIDYVANDLTNIIKESLEGTERVKRIVQDLKNFSHKDENEHKFADINDGIESTINVVWNELKYKADVKKEYGKIPLTKCSIGQLNQVFMNLLVNAVHAIEEHGEIVVKTECRDGDIVVSVSDTGCGIPEDKLNRIFEPFFTTKEIGEGTGLGLSIAYDIVKKHNGNILVTSEIGKGSTFTVKIPIDAE